MSPTLKRYLFSSAITFAATFFTTAGMLLSTGALDSSNVTAAAVLSIFFAASRAAVKAVMEKATGLTADALAALQ